MSARDVFHNAVRHALEKDGWTITHDPLEHGYGDRKFLMDLGAEHLLGAEREHHKIAVKVKSMLSPSPLSEFHMLLGQYLNYAWVLRELEPDRTLYLAVPRDAYDTFFSTSKIAVEQIRQHQMRLLVYSPGKESIVLWKP